MTERNKCTCGNELTLKMAQKFISIRCKNCFNILIYGVFSKKTKLSHLKMISKEEYNPEYQLSKLAKDNPQIQLK